MIFRAPEAAARTPPTHSAARVSDDGPGFAHDVHDRDPTRGGGQGLNLVNQLTTHWGMHSETSHVWFGVKIEVMDTACWL